MHCSKILSPEMFITIRIALLMYLLWLKRLPLHFFFYYGETHPVERRLLSQ